MIQKDQPACFDSHVLAAVSSSQDGQMQLGWDEPEAEVMQNRRRFLAAVGLIPEQTVLVRVRYHKDATYDVIRAVHEADQSQNMFQAEGELADCLVTATPGVALFLPVADCIGTIVYDAKHRVLALAHLGRHSTLAQLPEKLVSYLAANYQSNPEDLKIWMSPSIQAPHYVLKTADFAKNNPVWQPYCTAVEGGFSLDMQGYNQSRFIAAGTQPENIILSDVDTATDPTYWSHYTETTARGSAPPPRFAVACMLR